MIKNKENISCIIMKPFAECKCGIGKDWYHIKFEITFVPKETYPDYMNISKFISENISGKEFNIEQAVQLIGDMLWNKYNPAGLVVRGIVKDVVTHFPVEVIKEY
jgi:hypothetical protein